MTLKQYLFLMSFGAILCWVLWFLVLFFVDPGEAGIFDFIFFYLSLFLASVGSLSVLGLALRMKFSKDEVVFRAVTISFRQAAMLSFLVIGSLLLQSKNLLNWWNIIFLVLAVVIFEFFFITYGRGR
ncbi:hypothetical protein A2316_03330 [Candidatus Falkowbacteria bacterium RIFOXYB2_FULL_38_15]|nr:MAG: hypothetical protein A2316_03330 [Candidatus Falkowbacteria bacterium RIFOXYB2_FULL_38_15]OGF42375.1 MAG: hypothetical protein A2555_00305 [Candidatus Falkowbacteria bacterium RIFOXYD2_FULL_39_16]